MCSSCFKYAATHTRKKARAHYHVFFVVVVLVAGILFKLLLRGFIHFEIIFVEETVHEGCGGGRVRGYGLVRVTTSGLRGLVDKLVVGGTGLVRTGGTFSLISSDFEVGTGTQLCEECRDHDHDHPSEHFHANGEGRKET